MTNPKKFELESSIAYQVYVLARALRKDFFQIARANHFDLFPEQWFALYFIVQHPGQSQSELASRAFEDRASLSRTLASLIKKGLVQSSRDDVDRRAIRYTATEQGQSLYHHIARCIQNERKRVFEELDDGEIGQFRQTVSKLLNTLD